MNGVSEEFETLLRALSAQHAKELEELRLRLEGAGKPGACFPYCGARNGDQENLLRPLVQAGDDVAAKTGEKPSRSSRGTDADKRSRPSRPQILEVERPVACVAQPTDGGGLPGAERMSIPECPLGSSGLEKTEKTTESEQLLVSEKKEQEEEPCEVTAELMDVVPTLSTEKERKSTTSNESAALPQAAGRDDKVGKVSSFDDTIEMDAFFDGEAPPKQANGTVIEKITVFLQSNAFETSVTVLLFVNVIFLGLELQVQGYRIGHEISFYDSPIVPLSQLPSWNNILDIVDIFFMILFSFDVLIRLLFLRLQYFCYVMNWIDILVVISEWLVLLIRSRIMVKPMIFRLLRLGKLTRALRTIELSRSLDSLQLLLKCLYSSLPMLFWSFVLLVALQSIAGMIISAMLREYLDEQAEDAKVAALQRELFIYYGTFTRSFLTMFEVFFANWSPPCRILVDNVSEWFSLLFLGYRCILGFALLNVCNSVFVQQTMKCAASDEETAFRQKSREQVKYSHLLKRAFESLDASNDGIITLDEFKNLLENQKLRFWLTRLDLEYHDLLGLFELLDDGDGRISLEEFAGGVGRLKGAAKSIDVWRMETKMNEIMDKVISGMEGVRRSVLLQSAGLQNVADDHKRVRTSQKRSKNPS